MRWPDLGIERVREPDPAATPETVKAYLLALGPPAGRAVQYRISGPDLQKVRALAQEMASIVGSDPNLSSPVFDWNEPGPRREGRRRPGQGAPARPLVVGRGRDPQRHRGRHASITQVRDSIYLVDVTVRASEAERGAIETLQNLQLTNKAGQPVPLAAIATFQYELEQPPVWRRNRLPTITVKADIPGGSLPATVAEQLEPDIKKFTGRLPAGYRLAIGGPGQKRKARSRKVPYSRWCR